MAIARLADRLASTVDGFFAGLRAPGALPPPWTLTQCESDQGVTVVLGSSGGESLVVELDRLDPQRPCFARTRHFNVYYSDLRGDSGRRSATQMAVLAAVVSYVEANEHAFDAVLSNQQVLPAGEVQVREMDVDRVLQWDGPGAYFINPYVGCLVGCPFCYASHRGDLSRALQGAPKAQWGSWLDVKRNAAEILTEEVRRHPPGSVRLSPIITDPYQGAERRYRITRQCLQILKEAGFSPIVLTRESLVLQDAALLASTPGAMVGVSLCTDRDDVAKAFEPRAEPSSQRIQTLASLRAAGVTTFAMITPMLPMDPERLVALLAPHISVVHIGPLFERERIEATLRAAGLPGPLDEGWERATFERLRLGFETAGVRVNPTEPPWCFLH